MTNHIADSKEGGGAGGILRRIGEGRGGGKGEG